MQLRTHAHARTIHKLTLALLQPSTSLKQDKKELGLDLTQSDGDKEALPLPPWAFAAPKTCELTRTWKERRF